MTLAVILPSRGTMHSRTAESLVRIVKQYDAEVFWSHDNPIPECFNIPLQAALDAACDWIMILEEDVVVHDVSPLFTDDADITFMDYPVAGGQRVMTLQMFDRGNFTMAGFGCIAAKRQVWEALMPIRTSKYMVTNRGHLFEVPSNPHEIYGTQDINFFLRAQEAGYICKQVGTAEHWHVVERGSKINDGCDKLERYEYAPEWRDSAMKETKK